MFKEINSSIDELFVNICDECDLTYGNISPGQTMKLDEIKKSLEVLVVEFVKQNT